MSRSEPSGLDVLFRPRCVAVIGASRRRGSVPGEIFHNVMTSGYPGPVYPVNPSAHAVQSVRAYPHIAAVPDKVDLAVIAVPSAAVLETVEECAAVGVKGLVVITAGFAETGKVGRELQDELVRRVRAHGMRMLGPNCLGLLNTDAEVAFNCTFAPTWPPAGPVSVASQSGAVGLALLDCARNLGIGIRQFASTGNKAELSGNDLIEYWEADPATRVILLYLESFGNPKRFMQIARRVSKKKPIIVVKSGRTAAGAKAASSHTGALAGADVAVDALLGQAGVLRADTMEELFDLTVLLSHQPVPAGNRVAILTNAGGPGIMAADVCEARGLALPAPSAATVETLRKFLPAAASVGNPVDMLASAPASHYGRSVTALLADEGIDALLVLFIPAIVTPAKEVAAAICRAMEGAKKPVQICLMGTHGIEEALATLREAKVPAYAFPEGAVLALSRAVRYGKWLSRTEGRTPVLDGIQTETARKLVAENGDGWLSPGAVCGLLAAYGIRMPRTERVQTADEAAAAAEAIGFPVALKLVSDQILHKTEVGGVSLQLKSAEEVRQAYLRMGQRLAEVKGRMQGAIVQAMVVGGVETYIGMTEAAGFGALIGFGIGGIHVELWKDVVFRVHPLTDRDAVDMVEQIRAKALLDGFRGAPAADKPALVDAILRIDRLIAENPEIHELDVNPLLALPAGRGVIAIDARIRLHRAKSEPTDGPLRAAPTALAAHR